MQRKRKREYRYRDNSGSTMRSEEAFKHLPKIGSPRSIRGYSHHGRYNVRLAVMVRGDKGTVRFSSLCWGYGGTGPCGLRHLFTLLRIPDHIAKYVAHEIKGPDWSKARLYWHLELKDDGGYDLYLYNDEGKVSEHRRFRLAMTVDTFHRQLRLAL